MYKPTLNFITELKTIAKDHKDRQVIRHSIGLLKALQTTNPQYHDK